MTAVDDLLDDPPTDNRTLVERTLADSDMFEVDFTKPAGEDGTADRIEATDPSKANVVSSRIAAGRHAGRHRILVDLDLPAQLVPSSTPGHSHLYIDTACTTDQLVAVLDALVAAGAVESGYAGVSAARGYTCLRPPHIRKEPEDVVCY